MSLGSVVRARLMPALVLALVALVPARPALAEDPLTLAVHPYLAFDELEKRFAPLAEYLGKAIGREVEVRVGSSYAEHNEHIGGDEVDIAFMGPASYVDVVRKFGQKPVLAKFAIKGKPYFQGRIIVHRDSSLRSLTDVKGLHFAFGDRSSTMSHLVPRFMLHEAGVDIEHLGEHQFLGSHTNVALAVLSGDYEVGAVKEEVFLEFEPRGLKSLARTPAISEHLFVTRSNLPGKTVEAIRTAMLSLKDTENGRRIMGKIKKNMTAMVAAEYKDYKNLVHILKVLEDEGIR